MRIRASACGVCRKDLHIVDGELAPVFTGCTADGGFVKHVCLDERFVYPLGMADDTASLVPLMCAGLIGLRSFRAAGEAGVLGLYGFGASAHILLQVALRQARRCYVFTRPGADSAQAFARELGAQWAGGSDEGPPEMLDAGIILPPDGSLAPTALGQLKKGGRLVCAGIHMSDIPGLAYSRLWGESYILSLANLTREDAAEFLPLARRIGLKTHVTVFPLDHANEALADLRDGRFTGAAVLAPPA